MKRVLMMIVLVVILCTALSGCKGKEADELIGTWKMTKFNGVDINEFMTMLGDSSKSCICTVTFLEDGTGIETFVGEEDASFTWKENGDSYTFLVEGLKPLPMTIEDSVLVVEEDGVKIEFEKQQDFQ